MLKRGRFVCVCFPISLLEQYKPWRGGGLNYRVCASLGNFSTVYVK